MHALEDTSRALTPKICGRRRSLPAQQEFAIFMSQEQMGSGSRAAGAEVIAPVTLSHLLVAEDNRLNGLLMQEQLRLLGFSAELVTTGRDALARWRQAPFAALLTDIQMPGMDGYELASRIRDEEGDRPRMPIIALTANAFHDGSARWRAAGIDAYLMKPAELTTLKATLDQWIGAGPAPARDGGGSRVAERIDAPVDLGVLVRTVGDDPSVLADFLAAFSLSAAEAAHNLENAVATGDRHRAGSLAHQLKSSARAIGAVRLGELCEGLETAAGGAQDLALDASWQSFRSETATVLRWLASNRADAPQTDNDRRHP